MQKRTCGSSLAMRRRGGERSAAGAVLVSLFCATLALADAAGLAELKRLHEEVTRAAPPISVEAAESAADRLSALNLVASRLSQAERVRLLEAEVMIALARGDAATALARFEELESSEGEDGPVAALGLLTATAAGNAPLADDSLRRQRDGADADQNKRLALLQRRLRMVGREVPDLELLLEDGTKLSLRKRGGVVLVLDFWALRHRAEVERFAGLRRLFDAYRNHVGVQFVGVNSDGPGRLEDARRFAAEHFGWPQHYEKRTSDAALTHKGFQAGPPPWQVLVDAQGRVRAVADANEPGFEYALRAVVAETAGRFERLTPLTTDQKPRERPRTRSAESRARRGDSDAPPDRRDEPAEAEPAPPRKPEEAAPPAPPPGELPSNDEAASLLRQARAYIKTGRRTDARALFEQIVSNYPGTREAKEAQEYLRTMR